VFKRYYINPYVSPITGDLLTWNYTSLVICGIVFMILNYLIESGYLRRLVDCVRQGKSSYYEMKLTSQSSVLKREEKLDFYPLTYALKVNGLSKTYDGNDYAVSDVTFGVQKGECFGLLGSNGAGKSTIFAILSGQIVPTMGGVEYFDNVSQLVVYQVLVSFNFFISERDIILPTNQSLRPFANSKRGHSVLWEATESN
jgi:ABC-type transport system involved in cytochrome bd biosynthesis fused ATPase/permease subunit